MKIGTKILDTLDQAIRLRDKVLLVLSAASIASDWVEDEVTKACAEERQRGGGVLFPVRLDDAVFATKEAWALKLRDNRHIGHFHAWKDHEPIGARSYGCCVTSAWRRRQHPRNPLIGPGDFSRTGAHGWGRVGVPVAAITD